MPDASLELARIEYASMAIVTLAFRDRDLPETQGSGFLVPPVDKRSVKAATYSFAKWDWVREAGDGLLLMRCSIGRHREEAVLQRTDEEVVDLALADLADAVGLSVRPVDSHVQRWGGALPQYAVGHLDRVRNIRAVGRRRPRAGRLRRGVRRAGHPGLRRVRRARGHPGPRCLGAAGRMTP